MAEYSSSIATRQALINAAGSLFAKYGIDKVTTRSIAEEAKENPGLIHYHFGGKGDLLDAVLDFATEGWHGDPLGHYVKENEQLFETTDGRRKLICGLVDLLIDIVLDKRKPAWCGVLVFQILQRDIPVSDRIYGICAIPTIKALREVYERITGDSDGTRAFCWTAMTIFPMHLFSIDLSIARRIYHSSSIPEPVLDTLRNMTIRSSLVNLGLWDKALEGSFQQ